MSLTIEIFREYIKLLDFIGAVPEQELKLSDKAKEEFDALFGDNKAVEWHGQKLNSNEYIIYNYKFKLI
jgi:hypothetical protein